MKQGYRGQTIFRKEEVRDDRGSLIVWVCLHRRTRWGVVWGSDRVRNDVCEEKRGNLINTYSKIS